MRSSRVIALAVALFLASLVLLSASTGCYENVQSTSYEILHTLGLSNLFLILGRTNPSRRIFSKRKVSAPKVEVANGKLSLFKGREAKLNRAILLVLFQSGPLVVYDITKEIKQRRGFKLIRYSNVNRRVRALVEQGYLEVVGSRETKAGSMGALYQPTIRAKFAFYLNFVDEDTFVREASDEALTTGLAAIALYLEKDPSG